MNTLVSILSTVLLAYVGFGLLLFFAQRSILYYPTPVIEHGFEEEVFTTEVEVRVIVVNPGAKEAMLYFGGNADSMALNAPELSYSLPGYSIYLMNYRGYGGSGGSPTEAGIYADALYLYDELVKRHEKIIVVGRSLGSGVATYVAAQRPVKKLVLITPFDSVVSVAGAHYPIYPAQIIVKDRHDSIGRADKINAATLVLMAEHDRVIPNIHSERLADALAHVMPEAHVLDGVDHNSISIHAGYYPLIRGFLESSRSR